MHEYNRINNAQIINKNVQIFMNIKCTVVMLWDKLSHLCAFLIISFSNVVFTDHNVQIISAGNFSEIVEKWNLEKAKPCYCAKV